MGPTSAAGPIWAASMQTASGARAARQSVALKHLGMVLAFVCIALQLPLVGGLDIKSIQVYSDYVDGNWSLLESPGAPLSVQLLSSGSSTELASSTAGPNEEAARANINPWTFIGCFSAEASELQMLMSGTTPLICAISCDEQRGASLSAMQASSCYCLTKRPTARVDEIFCATECLPVYHNSTKRLCGGPSPAAANPYVSVYQKYDYVHQTAQYCYDPNRDILYQSVGVQFKYYDEQTAGDKVKMEWYLHASSINSGDPLFPYHQKLNGLLLGLQYDLDNSRIVGYSVPTWDEKVRDEDWKWYIVMIRVSSIYQHITFTQTQVPFDYDDSSANEYMFNTGVTALDAINNVYYITMPVIPLVPGVGSVLERYKTRLYGINLEVVDVAQGSRILLNQELEINIVLLESNSKFHDLFALCTSEDGFYYVKLGESSRNENTNLVQFTWTFTSLTADIINPYSEDLLIDPPKYYQVGVTAVDHVSNTSFFVYKDKPDADQPYHVRDMNQRGKIDSFDLQSLPSPAVQATWLVNTDPLIPLTLNAPVLLYARFNIDGQSIMVQFDSFTVEGALPVDTDGDYLPDFVDWGARQVGMRNCSDMFARTTAELLGDMPETKCQWRSGTTIQVHLTRGFDAIGVGDPLFLRDSTIYAYVQETNEWSYAASGGITISLPEPLIPPTIDIAYAETVDLCSSVTVNAENSKDHGGFPKWTWNLNTVTCDGGLEDTEGFTYNVRFILQEASVGGQEEAGQHIVSFSKDALEPGCTYRISVELSGRWGLSTTKQVQIYKRPIPAPQVRVSGSTLIKYHVRSRQVVIQTSVVQSPCETLLAEATSRTLKFEWTAEAKLTNAFNGARETQAVDFSVINVKTGSAALVVPKYTLEADAVYNMTVGVGYAETWTNLASKTLLSVIVEVVRGLIKVNVLGGGRKVMKTNPVALDATRSIDTDYPNDLVEANRAWEFSWSCTTQEGAPCFPNQQPNEYKLPDVRDCQQSTEQFEELGETYFLPSFSSSPLRSDAFYCRDTNKNGILILNLPNDQALMPGKYLFLVKATANDRFAEANVELEVTPGEVQGPQVLITPVEESKVPTTKALRLLGALLPADRIQFGDQISWEWSFFKKEVNPRWSAATKARLEAKGEAYQVAEHIFIAADELSEPSAFRTSIFTNVLVIAGSKMQASTTYAFRLTATAPHPYDENVPLVGYASTEVKTAGPPPLPGSLLIEPPAESPSHEPKMLTASFWTAEDLPLKYMFEYTAPLGAESSQSLRISPLESPSQNVLCFRPGEAVDDYYIKVTVTVTSLYGASTSVSQRYKSFVPTDTNQATNDLLERADKVDPESRAILLNCIVFGAETPTPETTPIPVVVPGPVEDVTGSTTTTTTTKSLEELAAQQATARRMVSILDEASDQSTVTSESVASGLQIVKGLAASGVVSDNMIGYVEKMSDAVADLAETAESEEEVDNMANAVFGALGEMGKTTAKTSNQAAAQARSRNMNAEQSGAFFPSSYSVAASINSRGRSSGFGGGAVGSAERRLKNNAKGRIPDFTELYPELSSSPRRLGSPLDEQKVDDPPYIVRPGAYPDWNLLPQRFRDPEYSGRRHTFHGRSASPTATEALADMYDQQEALELEWASYINATATQDEYAKAQVALDNEYFANYSAHLSAAERETVVREWWEERARMESLEASQTYQQAQLTQKTMVAIQRISSTLVKYMVAGELPKDFNFPMGLIRIGKTRDLQDADSSFHFKDSKWKLGGQSLGSFGYGHIKYTAVNPMSWSAGAPVGPFLVSSLEVFSEDGTVIPVERESQPLSIMSDHSSFASASCYYWDWEARDGLGGWSENGLLNSENGCSTTHLSLIGMFLDAIVPDDGIEVLSAMDETMDRLISKYNDLVIVGLGAALVLSLLLHYWGTKQDQADRTKPMEMKKLGDGIRGPRSQDDPVDYSSDGIGQACKTFWNLLAREHILVACFCRCPDLKTSRLQKVSALFAMIAGDAAVAALFFGEHVVDPKHFIEVGIIAAVITYPMVRIILMMFSLRPARAMPPPEQSIFSTAKPSEASFVGVLEAMPVPEDEEEDEEDAYGDLNNPLAALPPISGPLAAGGEGQANVALPLVRAHSPPAGRTLISAPEAGGGPQTGIFPQPMAVEQVLSGIMPPAPPHRPPPPPPPARGQPLATSAVELVESEEQVSQTLPRPPLPPPTLPPPPLSETLAAAAVNEGPAAGSGLPSPPLMAPEAAAGSPHESPERPAASSTVALPVPANPAAAPFGPVPQLPGEGDQQLAVVEPRGGLAPPLMPAPDSGAAEHQSHTQAQLLRRVRKMYIEKVIRNSERLAYDERVDMKSSVPHPMAQVANALAYTAVVCFWLTALVLTGVYSVHLKSKDAIRWVYSCLIGWAFSWFVLELVKATLVTILELQQLNQRRRIKDHHSLRDQVARKKAMKMKRMEDLAMARGIHFPGDMGQIERSPIEILQLPPPPVPPEKGQQPDASAGF